jgi:PhnB protein
MAKAASPIPAGFHTLSIHLIVKGAVAYCDFLKRAFNGTEVERSPGPGGKLMHATFKIGDSLMMFSDDYAEEMHMPPLAEGRMPYVVHMYVPDADAAWNQALAAGCTVQFPLADQFWGDRYGQVKDPFGIVWSIATRTEDLSMEERMERQKKAFGAGH